MTQGTYSIIVALLITICIIGVDEEEEVEGTEFFTLEEEERYTRRFDNGYDLPDPKYERWLRIHHPIAASVLSQSVTTSLLEGSSATPVHINLQLVPPVQQSRNDDSSTSHSLVEQSSSSLPLTDQAMLSGTPSSTGSVSGPKRSPLAELVNTPRISQDKRSKTGRARVLTSTECIRAFEEKEEQKRLAQEEKEKRKVERELKRRQKEEEAQRKKDEKARKAATRQRGKEAVQTSKQQHKQAQSSSKRKGDSSSTSRAKRSRTVENADNEIDSNRCCTCFGLFSDDVGTEREWLKCSCGRWIHEDCVDEDDINIDATKLCPLC